MVLGRALILGLVSLLISSLAQAGNPIVEPPDHEIARSVAKALSATRAASPVVKDGWTASWFQLRATSLPQPAFSPRRLPRIIRVTDGKVEHTFNRVGEKVEWKQSVVGYKRYSPSLKGAGLFNMTVRSPNPGSDTERSYVGPQNAPGELVITTVSYPSGTSVQYTPGDRAPEVVRLPSNSRPRKAKPSTGARSRSNRRAR